MSPKITRFALVLAAVALMASFPMVQAAAQGQGDRKSDAKKAAEPEHEKDGQKQKKAKKHPSAAPAEYGVAAVIVQRGNGAPAIWGTYSTRLGSPVGDTTGGALRFTCRTADVSCKISVAAAVLSPLPTTPVAFYPRLLVQRQATGTSPQAYCEYGDGVDSNGFAWVTPQASTTSPNWSPFTIHIGGSADCSGPDPTAGAVSQITVPVGYYDIFSTFTFKR